jgi:hypothetical protein
MHGKPWIVKKKKRKEDIDLVFLVVEDNERPVPLEGYGVVVAQFVL